jgi:glutathionylspermidine synthase
MEIGNSKVEARLSAYEYAYHIIKNLEWYREVAYFDHKQRSIGFGTKSYKWETITKEEVFIRYKKALQGRHDKIVYENPWLSTCKQWALISLYWNCPSCYEHIRNKITESRRKSYIYASWKKQWWLVKRRNKERLLYTTC